ncbi:Uma2 family endonuclease [Actinomadura rayongensis]|uniref:Uma2 family endonuclease n=1 Tax=Actinomadura rayongensis TaxID=1429076 RepID=A0A6I4WHS0_9ACTN|nr:Uma2 family endonuclease [Actinomadura rayongensis]MXQ67366.1 Uma2 family endonuclease [Actinomadura rayongensis]
MTAMVHDQHVTQQEAEDALLEGFLALETPEGFRAELIDGEIVVSPPPIDRHERIITKIVKQVYKNSSVDLEGVQNVGFTVPSGSGRPTSHVIPDIAFAPTEADCFDRGLVWGSTDGVVLVCEVTSSRPERDRETKRRCYAGAGLSLYLLVDREARSTTLFRDPEGNDYRASVTEPFGKGLLLPEPFGFELDTSEFT